MGMLQTLAAASLVPGVEGKMPPMTRPRLRIRLDDVAEAMDASGDHPWSLDLRTGEVIPGSGDLFDDAFLDDDEGDEESEDRETPHTESIPTLGSSAGHALRVRFADSRPDEELRFRLHD